MSLQDARPFPLASTVPPTSASAATPEAVCHPSCTPQRSHPIEVLGDAIEAPPASTMPIVPPGESCPLANMPAPTRAAIADDVTMASPSSVPVLTSIAPVATVMSLAPAATPTSTAPKAVMPPSTCPMADAKSHKRSRKTKLQYRRTTCPTSIGASQAEATACAPGRPWAPRNPLTPSPQHAAAPQTASEERTLVTSAAAGLLTTSRYMPPQRDMATCHAQPAKGTQAVGSATFVPELADLRMKEHLVAMPHPQPSPQPSREHCVSDMGRALAATHNTRNTESEAQVCLSSCSNDRCICAGFYQHAMPSCII